VPVEHKDEVLERLPENSMWVLAETGGKTAFVNQPPEPGNLPVASLSSTPSAPTSSSISKLLPEADKSKLATLR
jgi:hypothetical protein